MIKFVVIERLLILVGERCLAHLLRIPVASVVVIEILGEATVGVGSLAHAKNFLHDFLFVLVCDRCLKSVLLLLLFALRAMRRNPSCLAFFASTGAWDPGLSGSAPPTCNSCSLAHRLEPRPPT